MPDLKIDSIYNNVRERLESERLYLDSKMTLRKLSRIIGTNTVYLSKAINEGYGRTYKEVVNSYRIQYMVEQLRTHDDVRAEQIAAQCGFGSRSSFYSAFLQYTGMTPSKYVENLRLERETQTT